MLLHQHRVAAGVVELCSIEMITQLLHGDAEISEALGAAAFFSFASLQQLLGLIERISSSEPLCKQSYKRFRFSRFENPHAVVVSPNLLMNNGQTSGSPETLKSVAKPHR